MAKQGKKARIKSVENLENVFLEAVEDKKIDKPQEEKAQGREVSSEAGPTKVIPGQVDEWQEIEIVISKDAMKAVIRAQDAEPDC